MSLLYLLDTNICIYIAKQQPVSVLRKFEQLSIGQVAISTITYGELLYGVEKSQYPQKSLKILSDLITVMPALPISTQAGQHYGNLRAHLEKSGRLIGNNDLWIAAHALALEITLVTNNIKEFSRVPKLRLENWVI